MGTAIFQYLIFATSAFYFRINARELRLSQPTATDGFNYTLICLVTMTGYVRFSMNDRTVCTIINTAEDGSCIFSGDYDKRFTYTCNEVAKTYEVNIPGTIIYQFHNSRCVCEILYKEVSQESIIYVKVPVTTVTLSSIPVDTNPVAIIEDRDQRFECKTGPIRPTARIQWYISNTNLTSLSVAQPDSCYNNCNDDKVLSSSILMYKGNRTDNEKYLHCYADNIETVDGVDSNKKQLIIPYPSSVIHLNISSTEFTIREDSNVTLSCLADGKPSPKLSWTFIDSFGSKILLQTNDIGYSEFNIPNATCQHTGTLICIANNDLFPSSSKKVQINVACSPRRQLSCPKISQIRTNDKISLTTCWISNPSPEVFWGMISTENSSESFNISSYTYQNSSISCTSVFKSTIPDNKQMGYRVFARNNYGISPTIDYEVFLPISTEKIAQSINCGKDGDKVINIGIGFCTGLVSCVVTFLVIFTYKRKHRKQPRINKYAEFQSHGGIEINSYDTVGERKCVENVEKIKDSDETVHTYEECQIDAKEQKS